MSLPAPRNGDPPVPAKPKGTRGKINLLRQTIELGLREQAAPTISAVLDKAVDLALEGDRQMIKLLLELHMSRGAPEQEKAADKVEININSAPPKPAEITDVTPKRGDVIDAEILTEKANDGNPEQR